MQENKTDEMRRIFGRVLAEIKPSKEEIDGLTLHTNELMLRLKRIVAKDVEIEVVGSTAHGTNLRGDTDIDIFLLFKQGTKREEMVKNALSYARRIVRKGMHERYEIKYAEHPYARVYLDDYNIKADIVPAIRIKSIGEIATAVDRSPLHVEFINRNLSEKQKDDVRLLKYFLKVHGIYGAETKIGGFSGYLCELLIYHYGSLENALANLANMKLPLGLDPKGKIEIKDPLLFRKFNTDFLVLDPVDPDRNVAAGVSKESLARLALIASMFIERPSIRAFYGKGFSEAEVSSLIKGFMERTGLHLYMLVVRVPDKSSEIIWPELRKVSEKIVSLSAQYGFSIYITLQWISKDRGIIAFFAPEQKLKSRIIKGPSAFQGKHALMFIKSHKNDYGFIVDGESISAIEANRYKTVRDVFEDVAKGKLGRYKDISFSKAALFVDKVPKRYREDLYAELIKKISI
ncbi:MAG: CCA tRNA nucleotidyltransferase [Candidatus Micrarchaeaceae archaeon]